MVSPSLQRGTGDLTGRFVLANKSVTVSRIITSELGSRLAMSSITIVSLYFPQDAALTKSERRKQESHNFKCKKRAIIVSCLESRNNYYN